MSVPVATIVGHVLVNGLAVYASGEPIKPADAITVVDAINLVLDDWRVETLASYAEVFTPLVTTGANPETLGPTGTWPMAARPVAIDGLGVALTAGIYTSIPVTTDPTWWADQSPLTGGLLTGAYYSADVPNGSLYLNSPPAAGTGIRLMQRTTLGPVLLTDVLVWPPGYQSAIEFTVMERVVDAFHGTLTANQIRLAGVARQRIFSNNLRVPSLSTRGLGLPGTRGGRWDYRTGGSGGGAQASRWSE
jgi:hypothetical protein